MPSEPAIFPINGNLRVAAWNAADNPRAVILYFQAREAEEPVSFFIDTDAIIISSTWRMPQLKGGQWLSLILAEDSHRYAIALDRKFLDKPFIVGLELAVEGNPRRHITAAGIWDRAGGEAQIVYREFAGES